MAACVRKRQRLQEAQSIIDEHKATWTDAQYKCVVDALQDRWRELEAQKRLYVVKYLHQIPSTTASNDGDIVHLVSKCETRMFPMTAEQAKNLKPGNLDRNSLVLHTPHSCYWRDVVGDVTDFVNLPYIEDVCLDVDGEPVLVRENILILSVTEAEF